MDNKRVILHLGNFKLDKFRGEEYAFYITKATEEQLEEIKQAKQEKKLDTIRDKYDYIDLDNIYIIGDGHSGTARYKVASILDTFFTHKGGDLQLHYRDYERSLENQKKMSHLINICPDSEMSWYSVLRKIGYWVYSRNCEIGRMYKERNDNLICNIIIWKQKI